MPFEAVTNLASVQAAEEERKRRQQQAALASDEAALKQQRLERTAEDVTGPAGVLASLTKGSRTAVDADVLKAAGEDEFLNAQAQRRFQRRQTDLGNRAEQLAVPGPTAAERAVSLSAPLGRFATEDDSSRSRELATDPRGRLAELERVKDQIAGVSRETSSPIYTDAPRAHRGSDETMPYNGRVDALGGAEVSRSAIAPEFGGTGSGVLSFSDRRGPGMRPYQSRSGTTKDVGAPGGGLVSADGSDGPTATARAAQVGGLDELIGEAQRQPFSPQEKAADLAVQQPAWDIVASQHSPEEVIDLLNRAVGDTGLNPATGQNLMRRYQAMANEYYDEDGQPDPEHWRQRLTTGRLPAPGEAEHRAATGGQAVPQAEAEAQHATQQALQAPQDGPGSTRSPALAAESREGDGFFSGLAGAAQRGTDRLSGGAPMPATPEGFPGPGDVMRVAVPMAAAAATGGASIPVAAATGFGAGAGSELLGELFNGEPLDARRIGATGALDAAGGAAVPALTRLAGKGFGAVRSLARRFSPDAIPGVYGPEWTAGAPTRVLGGLREEAGASRAGMSSLARTQQGSAEAAANVTAAPNGPLPYLEDRLPALRGGGFELGAEGPLSSAARPFRAPRQLTGPAEPEVMDPEAVLGQVFEGEVMPNATAPAQIGARGAEEGAKQLVPLARKLGVSPDDLLTQIREGLLLRRQQGIPVTARDTTELLAMLMRAGG